MRIYKKIKAFLLKYQNHTTYLILFLILSLGFILRFPFLQKPIWYDESWRVVNLSQDSFVHSLTNQAFAPIALGIFLISRLTILILGNNELGIRLFIFLCGILIPFAAYLLTKRLSNKKCIALFATFVFAVFHPYILYSYQYKPYAVEVLLTILVVYFFDLYWEDLNNKKIIILGIVLFFTVYFSMPTVLLYPSIFILLGVKLVKSKKFKELFYLCISAILILINVALYYVFYLKPQTDEHMYRYWDKYFLNPDSNFKDIFIFLSKNSYYIFNEFIFPFSSENIFFLSKLDMPTMFIIILLISIVIFYFKRKIYYFMIIVGGMSIMFILSVFHKWTYGAVRMNLFMFSLITIIIIVGIGQIIEIIKNKNIKLTISICILATLFIIFPYNEIKNNYLNKNKEYPLPYSGMKGAVKCVKDNFKDGDNIVVYHQLAVVVFKYYYLYYNKPEISNANIYLEHDEITFPTVSYNKRWPHRSDKFFKENLKKGRRLWVFNVKEENIKNISKLIEKYGYRDDQNQCNKYGLINVILYNGK